ncbi:ATP-binding protein [Sphingobium yanoikuyae]|uniref:ATP-binding protein n=1 Tax=Sphingobium yanoikuyae TaxID=13690 RepID=UPI0028AD254A|nr:ATP-binding protein [Sphingobium yanoikuyae]
MRDIAGRDIQARIMRDNPWWNVAHFSGIPEGDYPRRVYFGPFKTLALNFKVRRAAILLGPRRVGKTVMIKQVILDAIKEGVPPGNVLYASIDTPLYSGMALTEFLEFVPAAALGERCVVVFDEIQYLKDWETHLKDLVDSYPNVKFVASGSAAAALRLKSRESGAGRFSDFMLPPLTFYEFLEFTNQGALISEIEERKYQAVDIEKLNLAFIDYLNFGGYPEAALNEEIRNDPDRFIRSDIIEKVLLKDLPSLYGIQDIQGLNKLFMYLAYNTGAEATLDKISQSSGMAKPTIKKYIEYLESAFLIIKVSTVDDTCRSLQRERHFKIYLNNPSIRAALFSPVRPEDTVLIGHLAESAVFSQWQHSASFDHLRYARWKNEGEVDVVYLDHGRQKPSWIGEVKWSDRVAKNVDRETRHMKHLIGRHEIHSAFFTTRTEAFSAEIAGVLVDFRPTALYCYMVGRNITRNLDLRYLDAMMDDESEIVAESRSED